MSNYNNSPYKKIPRELLNAYTQGHKIKILDWYIDESKKNDKVVWNENIMKDYLGRFTPENIKNDKQGKESYKGASKLFLEAFEKYNITGKNVAVIGSQTPWLECILLNLKNNVTTVEYNVPEANHPDLKCINYFSSFKQSEYEYDVIATFSSIEHSGLGRYGDPLDPEGDIKVMKDIHKNLKKEGLLLWGAPVGHDALVWNAHRVYGKLRLPLIFENFKEKEWLGFEKEKLLRERLHHRRFGQPVVVLEK